MFKSILKHEAELVQLYGKVPKKLLPEIELTADDFHYMKQFTEAFEPIYHIKQFFRWLKANLWGNF